MDWMNVGFTHLAPEDKRELVTEITRSVLDGLAKYGMMPVQPAPKPKRKKNAVEKTETLLLNYENFKRAVEEKHQEIADIKKYGVGMRRDNVHVQTSTIRGIVLEEETVESAVHNVQTGIDSIVRVICAIDSAMTTLRSDPWYDILEMRYFEGRTQEDIADYYGCAQSTVSANKDRLLKELALRLFPDIVLQEMLE
jgi:hypothetical protein